MNDKAEAAMAIPEQPVWQRAHDTLNNIYHDMENRLKEIEANINRLHGEREAIVSVLTRIGSPAPQPMSATPGYPTANTTAARW